MKTGWDIQLDSFKAGLGETRGSVPDTPPARAREKLAFGARPRIAGKFLFVGQTKFYVNYPSTEYLQLPFLDIVSFNVYLESANRVRKYVARLHNIAADRPLIMTQALDPSFISNTRFSA
jgi:hypothetical protein